MQIGIIGAGQVGAATAFALMMRGVARKITLIDTNNERALAEATDIAHAAPFAYANKVKVGDYKDLESAGIIIITAGANQKPGETRIDLLERNIKIFSDIIPKITAAASNAILIVATNPVDIMTYVTLKLSGFPKDHVLGSGTVLDTARFRTDLGYHLGISPKSLHANVLGEHGDSEVLCWSNGDGGTIPLMKLAEEMNKPFTDEIKQRIDDDVRNAAYKIIAGKGATYFGIAGALCRICQAISTNEYAILTVSSLHKRIADIENVCLSMPTIIGKRGIHNVLYPRLDEEESFLLGESIQKMKAFSLTADQLLGEKN